MHNYALLLLLLFNLPSSRATDNVDDKNYDDFPQSPPIIRPSQTIQLGVSTTRIKDEDTILEERFGRIINEAATISRSLKYGLEGEEGSSAPPSLPSPSSSSSSSSSHLLGKLIKRDSDGKRTILHFIVEMNGRIVQSEAIVRDISLLTMAELSAILQYPVSSISTTSMQVVEESATWWKIGLIIGGGVILLLLGWCCLFVYFNTCGRVTFIDQRRKEELYEEKMDERREENDQRQLGQVKDERKEMRTNEKIDVGEERQREVVVSERERKKKEEPVEKSRDEDMRIRDEEKKKEEKKEDDESRRDSIESLEISEEAGEELQDDSSPLPVTSSRPRAAGLRRPMRTVDGRVITENPPSEWTKFSAGDRVNAIFSIRPPSSYDHPTPSPSTLNGVVQYSTTQGNTAFSHFL